MVPFLPVVDGEGCADMIGIARGGGEVEQYPGVKVIYRNGG